MRQGRTKSDGGFDIDLASLPSGFIITGPDATMLRDAETLPVLHASSRRKELQLCMLPPVYSLIASIPAFLACECANPYLISRRHLRHQDVSQRQSNYYGRKRTRTWDIVTSSRAQGSTRKISSSLLTLPYSGIKWHGRQVHGARSTSRYGLWPGHSAPTPGKVGPRRSPLPVSVVSRYILPSTYTRNETAGADNHAQH